MTPKPRIYVDYNNCDSDGCMRLNTVGSLADIAAYPSLRPGMSVVLYDEELEYDAVLEYDDSLGLWKGRIISVLTP